MCCRDYDNKEFGGLEYTGVVKEVFYNYPLKFVCIIFVCEEVRKNKK